MAVLKGISFPFRKGTQAFPEPSEDDALIKDSLIQIVMTGTGERVMRPGFGTNAKQFIFESNNAVLSSLIQTEISAVIQRYEPRVTLSGVQVLRVDSEVTVTIAYIVNLTGQGGAVSMSLGQAAP